MSVVKSVILSLLFLFSCFSLQAQYLFRGRVLDESTREPVPEAYVYLDGTSIYTTTDKDGRFELETANFILNASLVISHVSYESESIKDPFNNKIPEEIYIRVRTMREIIVHPVSDREKANMLSAFKREFLGTTPSGNSCKILNEDELSFSFDDVTKTLRVFTSAPLIIENSYLGYRVTYDLQQFYAIFPYSLSMTATLSFFEGLSWIVETNNSARIRRRRDVQYENSREFFMRNLANNTLSAAKITLYNNPRPQPIEKIDDYFNISEGEGHIKTISIRPGTDIDTGENDFFPVLNILSREDASKIYGVIEVLHNRNSSSIIFVAPDIQVDVYGNASAGVFFNGHLGQQRAGNLLPINYGYDDGD